MAQFLQVGTIRMSQAGKLYIKFHATQDKSGTYTAKNLRKLADALEGANEKEGVALQIEKPQDKINRMHGLGFIDDDKLEGRLASIPDYIKYEVTLVVD